MKRYCWSMIGALALGGTVGVMQSAIAPLVAQAYTARVDLTLASGKEETYEVLLNRAENVARAAVQRSFDADLLATDVIVIVVGDRGGIVAPIMDVRVSRAEWRSRPDVAYWGDYYLDARALLGFESFSGSASETTTSPVERPSRPATNPAGTESDTTSPSNSDADATPGETSDEIPDLDRGPGEIETPRPFVIPVDPFNPLF
ncbi:MAG: hypothetical protein ACTS2F_00730 [Thainema sp.]